MAACKARQSFRHSLPQCSAAMGRYEMEGKGKERNNSTASNNKKMNSFIRAQPKRECPFAEWLAAAAAVERTIQALQPNAEIESERSKARQEGKYGGITFMPLARYIHRVAVH